MLNSISPVHFFPDYTGKFGDKRLEKRAKNLWSRLSDRHSSSIRQISTNKAEQKAFYRFLNNDSVKEDDLIEVSCDRMSKLSNGRHLLCIQDTCEVNLSQHKGRVKDNIR